MNSTNRSLAVMRLLRLLIVLLSLNCIAADSKDYYFDDFILSVPRGYSGPHKASPAPSFETIAFSVLRDPTVPTNVLQLTRYDAGKSLPDQAAQKYLLDMLKGPGDAPNDELQRAIAAVEGLRRHGS